MKIETDQTMMVATKARPLRAGALHGIPKCVWNWILAPLLPVFICFSVESSKASLLSNNLSATINLSGVQSASMGITQTTVRREMTGNCFKNLTPYLSLYASAAYFKTDMDRTYEIGLFKKEFSPSAKLSLNHPQIRMNANLSRTESVGSILSEEMTRTSFSADLQTRLANLPVFSAEVSSGTTRDNQNHRGKNANDNSFGLALKHDLGDWTGRYRMGRTGTRNLVTEFESTTFRHTLQARWGKEVFYKKPVKLYGDYLFSYRTQTDRIPEDSAVLHVISPVTGLYGEHQDGTYGWLDPRNDLTDNDLSNPTSPAIDIGIGSTNQHLGVDFTIKQWVGGLYVYTDRLSDESVTWVVYVSDEGLEWQIYDLSPRAFFDAGVNRYEMTFEPVLTRYVKAVSGGLNRIETVYVTEIVALAEVANQGEVKQSNQFHRINLGASLQLNEKWKASSDMSFQRVPSVGLAGRRDSFGQSVLVSYRATDALLHSFRFQFNLNSSADGRAGFSDYLLSYNAGYNPLPTLKLTGSASGRVARTDGKRETEGINLSGKLIADPIEDLTFEMQLVYGWDNRHAVSRRSDSWDTRIGLNARPSRTLEFRLAYGYRAIDVKDAPDIQPQREYMFTMTLRPVRKIQINGQISKTSGRHEYLQQQLSANWSFTKTLSVSGQYRHSIDSEGFNSERQLANLSWRLGARANIYLGYSKNDLSGQDASSESINAGIRMRL